MSVPSLSAIAFSTPGISLIKGDALDLSLVTLGEFSLRASRGGLYLNGLF